MLILKDPAANSAELSFAAKALQQGELVIVPTDTVYGIAANAADEQAIKRLYAAKGRALSQPTAVIWPSVKQLRTDLEALGANGLSTKAAWAIEALLPGPWTLLINNSYALWPHLTGQKPGAALGVRVPAGALNLPPHAATSANLTGMPVIHNVREAPKELASLVSCAIDRGELNPNRSGGASTILDLTKWERGEGDVLVVRDEAARAGQAIAALASIL